jgi:hypothetical protein
MTDKELLELAAKVSGFITKTEGEIVYVRRKKEPKDDWYEWNPLEDDGDALRLAAELVMDIEFIWDVVSECTAIACVRVTSIDGKGYAIEELGFDSCKAIRTAIVKTAAEIGEQIE